jgi:hypothetical protein
MVSVVGAPGGVGSGHVLGEKHGPLLSASLCSANKNTIIWQAQVQELGSRAEVTQAKVDALEEAKGVATCAEHMMQTLHIALPLLSKEVGGVASWLLDRDPEVALTELTVRLNLIRFSALGVGLHMESAQSLDDVMTELLNKCTLAVSAACTQWTVVIEKAKKGNLVGS